MLEALNHIDRTAFLFLNSLHCAWLDPVMFWGTKTLIWIPLFLFLLYFIIRTFKWQTLWIVLFAAIMITVSDQLSNFSKELVARPRPTHDPYLSGVHTVYSYFGGLYGFYSGHASNTMAITIFFILLMHERYGFFPLLLFPWALFMSYTRIYLGVHYPGDVLFGMIIGAGIGYTTAILCRAFLARLSGNRG